MKERQFNTAGPCEAEDHYLIDPLERIHYEDVLDLIESKRYFVLHAPRQTGKTTSLRALVRHLNTCGQYRAVYANIEGAQTARHDVALGIGAVIQALARQLRGEVLVETSRGMEVKVRFPAPIASDKEHEGHTGEDTGR